MKYDNQYDMMTKQPVPSLILKLGLPTTISMLVTSIYNMADSYFVGKIGTSASGATGIVFGLMAILQAVGFMFGHGAGSIISRRLGARDIENARKFSATSFYSALIAGSLILIIGLTFITPLMRLLGSTDTILPYAKSCIAAGGSGIYARQLDHRMKVFTTWDPDKYYLGVEGDFLAVRADDLTDIYIIAKSVFERTYRLTE